MGKVTGFLEFPRVERRNLPAQRRIGNFAEFVVALDEAELARQGARCMDCGVPYCHTGCPVNNIIPDWNDLVYRGDWRAASEVLHSTNNFPEFTGRICPAPCETACTLYLNDSPVTIKTIEHHIVERAWAEGWIQPQKPARATATGKRVAIVGAGPAGLACAQQLARAGYGVSLYDRQERAGGLLRYGIPDFKLDKGVIDRRMAQLQAEGVEFHGGVHIGVNLPARRLQAEFDAVVLAGGAEQPRDLDVPGRELAGIHFAMAYLRSSNRRVQGAPADEGGFISARGRHVVVLGGGDTGSDCIGTANRQGAASITQIEILSRPPEREDKDLVWPHWPHKFRTSSSQEEGCERLWDVVTTGFVGDRAGRLVAVRCKKVDWHRQDGSWRMKEVAGSEFELPAGLVTLALGFLHPRHPGMLADLAVRLDARGNVDAPEDGENAHRTNLENVFSAGDMRRGQSLVVWAIREGRRCARAVDLQLRGHSDLPAN